MFGVQRIGRYEVLSHLASGGMGQVYLARSTGLGGFERQVVVKTLDLSITDDDDAFVTMFLDEARLVGALHHQYIAPVYEVGCDDEGRYYLVMDYVNGETAELVYRASSDRSWPVPLNFALTVVSCVASALDYAHSLCAEDGTALDIVHRDISLSNVMVGYDGAVKLIDFGIAKAANRATKTQVGTLKGKIGYLAPEQILRKPVDHRADIFALGIVLYELTTATRAFRETSDLVTLERITNGEIKRPSDFTPNYPPELERIVLKALQVDPDLRYQDAATMGRELERLAAQMNLALGHTAIREVMTSLFGEQRRGRRRIARGSSDSQRNDVTTDPSVDALDDEKTPIVDLSLEEPEVRRRTRERSLKPTTPLAKRNGDAGDQSGERIPIEDAPTPISDPLMQVRAQHALIPIEDRPTPLAERSLAELGLPLRPTPTPTRDTRVNTPPPDIVKSARVLTPIPGATARMNTPTGNTPVGMQVHTPTRTERSPSPRHFTPPPQFGERRPLPLTVKGTPPPPTPGRVAQHTPPRPARAATDDIDIEIEIDMPRTPRLPTGPQLPVVVFRHPSHDDIADMPTHITGMRAEREDPTDTPTNITSTRAEREDPTDVSSGPMGMPAPQPPGPPKRMRTQTAQIVVPQRSRWAPSTLSKVVLQHVHVSGGSGARTWLLLCGLFAIAVAVAIAIALL
ncbi:MAG TPA: protein kinase [Kofleriaceae bacterium]